MYQNSNLLSFVVSTAIISSSGSVLNCNENKLPIFVTSNSDYLILNSSIQNDERNSFCDHQSKESINYSKELISNLITINSFGELLDNWDGEGAKVFLSHF